MKVFGSHDAKTLAQLEEVARHAEFVALMADGHLGYSMPIGGVAAFDNKVSVTGVGFDIACGNCAIKLDRQARQYAAAELREIGCLIQASIAFGVGRANSHPAAPVNHEIFDDPRWSVVPRKYRARLRDKARDQLGSAGSGNHYVDLFEGEDGALWVGVHFGSRGLGHTIASAFIAISQGGRWGDRGKEGMTLLSLDSVVGEDYWDLMSLAGDYAYAGRDWVADTVAQLLGGHVVDRIHNNHNFAWQEEHDGRILTVVRKGATPAWPGERGFVGGSMGDDAVILHGSEHVDPAAPRAALYSTVHGAGRVMSRTQATGRSRRGKARGTPGVDIHEAREWIEKRGVLVFGSGLDEAPQAYRRLDEVLAAQGETVEILHTLRPLVVVMAASDFDSSGSPLNPFLYSAR